MAKKKQSKNGSVEKIVFIIIAGVVLFYFGLMLTR